MKWRGWWNKLTAQPEMASFPEVNCVYGADQPEYRPLPCVKCGDERGTILFCWKLSLRDRLRVLLRGELWYQVLTFKAPLQPQNLSTDKPGIVLT